MRERSDLVAARSPLPVLVTFERVQNAPPSVDIFRVAALRPIAAGLDPSAGPTSTEKCLMRLRGRQLVLPLDALPGSTDQFEQVLTYFAPAAVAQQN